MTSPLPCRWLRRTKARRDGRDQSALQEVVQNSGEDASLFLAVFQALRCLVLEVAQHFRVRLKRYCGVGSRPLASSLRRHGFRRMSYIN